ncbi:MAG: hypothetical protein WAV45_09425 [Propionibacteriaceae bacterium]|mgnify:CR=1 FL=1|jgi:hypothetical protein|nr:hypothetical protein [Micropruina sp.]MBK9158603.1 hypothetical protein [Micropruina sp.]
MVVRRLAGQQVACGWCGKQVMVKARGPVPKWCSAACRQRAWEASRAAAAGTLAVRVVDRQVLVVPGDGAGWVEQLGLLARQLGQGPGVVADYDLDAVTDAVELVADALTQRQLWRGRFEPWE